MSTVRVRVLDGWAVFDGERQRTAGELVNVDHDIADAWLAAGWVEPAKAARKQ